VCERADQVLLVKKGRKVRMMRTIVLATVLAAALALWAGPARATMAIYDDFDGTAIDTSKWDVGTPVTEVSGSILRLPGVITSYGHHTAFAVPQADDVGESCYFEFLVRNYGTDDLDARSWQLMLKQDGVTKWGPEHRHNHGGIRFRNGDGVTLAGPRILTAGDWYTIRVCFENVGGTLVFSVTEGSDTWYSYVPNAWPEYIDNIQIAGTVSSIGAPNVLGQMECDYVGYEYVPEPASMMLMAIGGVAALVRRRRR
jgi:hypothetical protein